MDSSWAGSAVVGSPGIDSSSAYSTSTTLVHRIQHEADTIVSAEKADRMAAEVEELRYLEEARHANQIAADYARQIADAQAATEAAVARTEAEAVARQAA
eukprot:COSAG02_NODE_43589_length_373_cov_0.934307_1_plen_99_part_01